MPIADRPMLGILLMTGFCVLAPLGDSIAKILGDTIPLAQLLFVRFAMQAMILVPLAVASRIDLRLSARALRLTVLRTLLHIVGIGAMFASLRYLPLADAIAIAFVMPFLMLLLGKFVLGEQVGPYRLGACLVGFVGTLLVIRPNYAEVGAPALLPLVVAIAFALFMLVTRQVAKAADPIALQGVSGVIASVLIGAMIVLAPDHSGVAFPFDLPSPRDTALLAAIGVLGTVAHLLMTWSLRLAPSATLAPMQYLEIPFATLIGWMIFRDLPDAMASAGIALTVGAGLYVIHREQIAARRATRQA
ncbi:DMT family transporter [Stappia stellulata]|uniref:DMT family transporter n=1 Tax=Stappia TaxID=152161 RepID=UPI001CD51FD9|nr:DMT family transporter [Stappia stellulata]MCA1243641.1 DMT family transporter [Stappia stellulata]